MKPKHKPPQPGPLQQAIQWQGKTLPLGNACALALAEHSRGNTAAAVDIYALVLQRVPMHAEGHNNRGVMLQFLQRHEEALVCYDRALALRPDYLKAHFNRGTALSKLRRREEALASYDRAIVLNPNYAEAYVNRGVVLQDLKRYRESLASYDRAIALDPKHPEAHNNRGIVLANLGRMAEAEQMFIRASELKPGFADPLFNLANIRDYHTPNQPELDRIFELLNTPDIGTEKEEHLFFSLGKIHDDCGRYDEAFEYFRRANDLRSSQVAYDPTLIEQMTDRLITVFSREFLAQPFPFSADSRSPLFVVGMPRSGTTLVASMLSNHPAIAAAGELPTLGELLADLPKSLSGGAAYPEAIWHINATAAAQVAASYEQRLRRDVTATVTHVVDKNPLNFRHVGLISLLFPQARIIHCTRHPAATCLSNFFQRFPLHMDYSFDLRNIGHFYREYARLMAHWRQQSGIKMIEVAYEDMVLHTEPTARRVLEFLGLPFDERCLATHTNRFPVETASQWQVRQPIYQDSLDNWRHYERHLDPLREILPGLF